MSLTTSNFDHNNNLSLYCPINQINNQTLQGLPKEFYVNKDATVFKQRSIQSDSKSGSQIFRRFTYDMPPKCDLSEKMKIISAQNPVCKPIEFNVTLLTHANSLPFSPFKHMYIIDRMTSDDNWLKQIDTQFSDPNAIHLIPLGISKSYLIKDKFKKPLGIYKPNDEAGGTYDSNEATVRELGARLVGGDFCNVPEMHQIKLIVNGALQQGSLQKFADHDGSLKDLKGFLEKILLKLCDIDPQKEVDQLKIISFLNDPEKVLKYRKMVFEQKTSLHEKMAPTLHRVGLLDILIQNPDRNSNNGDNLLYKNENNKIKLIPIDHNLAFPKWFEPLPLDTFWFNSPSSLQPFDEETKKFVVALNIKKVCRQLAEIGMSKKRIRNFKIMAHFVKKGVENNLSLIELGLMAAKVQKFKKTEFEQIVSLVTYLTVDDKIFFKSYKQFLDIVFKDKKKKLAEEGVTDLSRHYVPLLKKETFETSESFQIAQTNLQNFLMS